MLRKLPLLIFLLLSLALVCNAQYSKLQGYAGEGGSQITIGSITTSTKYQKSYSSCTVTVFDAGTSTPSTIYSNSTGTLKSNPFTASSTGYWFFYASPGSSFDIQFSGTGFTTFTLGDYVAPLASSGRLILNSTPNFNLATNSLATDLLISHSSVTISSSKTFSAIRLSQADGSDNSYTAGASSITSNVGNFIKALSGSDSTSNVYGEIIQADNAGPGTVKALHILAQGVTGSTGVLTGMSLDVKPVTGQGSTFDLQIASSGINNVVRGIIFTSNGGNFDYGIDFLGFASSPSFNSAAIRLPNNTYISGRNAGNSADVSIIKVNALGVIELGTNLSLQTSNPAIGIGNAGTDQWSIQKIDSDARLRLFKDNVGELWNIATDGKVGMGSVTFSNLGTPANGTFIFCSNCNAASSPCSSGGTGAFAFRQGSAWKCL